VFQTFVFTMLSFYIWNVTEGNKKEEKKLLNHSLNIRTKKWPWTPPLVMNCAI